MTTPRVTPSNVQIDRRRVGTFDWEALAVFLRDNPGQWFIAHDAPTTATPWQIRRGIPVAMRPAGHFDARRIKGELHLVYLGESDLAGIVDAVLAAKLRATPGEWGVIDKGELRDLQGRMNDYRKHGTAAFPLGQFEYEFTKVKRQPADAPAHNPRVKLLGRYIGPTPARDTPVADAADDDRTGDTDA